jgi:DNA-binding XRE family transcriptional regulator
MRPATGHVVDIVSPTCRHEVVKISSGGCLMDDRFVLPDGDKIRRIRQGNFWSQEQLADRAALRKRTIERAEAGERLQRGTLHAIAQALSLSPEALVMRLPKKGARLI